MSDRSCSSIFIALACVLAVVVETRAEPPGNAPDETTRPTATANGPVSLLTSPPPPSREQPDPGGQAEPAAPGSDVAPTAAPPLESRTLGGLELGSPEVLRSSSGSPAVPETGGDRSLDVVRVLGALAGVVGLILLLRLCVRRGGGARRSARRPSGVLEVLARYPVGRGQQLMLLKVARRVLLVHQSGGAMTTLSELTEPDEVAAILSRLEAGSNRTTRAFKSALRRFEQDHRVRDTTPRGAALLPGGEPRVVDLTDSPHATLRRLLDSRRVEA